MNASISDTSHKKITLARLACLCFVFVSRRNILCSVKKGSGIIWGPYRTTRRVPQEKFPQKPYNKSFIDRACSVKMVQYWPRSFLFCVFIDLDSVSVHKLAKKELGQYPAILTSHLVNNPYIQALIKVPLCILCKPRLV